MTVNFLKIFKNENVIKMKNKPDPALHCEKLPNGKVLAMEKS
jgi:hypothetical protein